MRFRWRLDRDPSHHGLLLIGCLTLVAIALIAVVWRYYTRQKQILESAFENELAAVAEVKAKQVTNWRNERIGDGRVSGSSANMQVFQHILSDGAGTGTDRADVLDLMNRLATAFGYANAALVDQDGHPRVQLHADGGIQGRYQELVRAGLGDGVFLSDLYRDTPSGRVLMSLIVPAKSLGALILDIDAAQFLYPYVEYWPAESGRIGVAATTILMRRDFSTALYLSGPQHTRGTAVNLQDLFRGTPGITPQVLVARGPFKAIDNHGVPVLLTVCRVADSPWYLMAKVDESEVDLPVRGLSWQMALSVILIAGLNAAGIGFIWESRRRRIGRDQQTLLSRMANDTPAYLWIGDERGANSFINKQCATFLGIPGDRLGEDWVSYIHPDDAEPARAELSRCVATRSECYCEFRLRRYDGVYRWMISRGVPRFSGTGEFLGYAGSLTDITERKQAEDQLRATHTTLVNEAQERTRTEKEILSLSARLITVQEEERARLAGELHDDIGQQLAALSIATSILKKGMQAADQDGAEKYERIHTRLAELAESVRRISHTLHPALLQHSGLEEALGAYCSEFGSLTGIQVSFKTEGSCQGAPSEVALCIYRVAQEALQNVAKHAQVDRADVTLSRGEDRVTLKVSDGGVGFEQSWSRAAPGLGFVSIRERARLVNGKTDIRSQPNEGTTVTLIVPVPAPASV